MFIILNKNTNVYKNLYIKVQSKILPVQSKLAIIMSKWSIQLTWIFFFFFFWDEINRLVVPIDV